MRWWDGDEAERYWLETTDRPDIGVDLKAPQTDDSGTEHAAYVLIREVNDGDVVFHYHKPRRAIVSWSRIVGDVFAEDIVWAAHGTVARESGVQPYRRPGWRIGLQGPYPLQTVVTLDDLREREPYIREVWTALRSRVNGPIFFPLELSDKRPLRPTQFYLTKVPVALVLATPQLLGAANVADQANPSGPGTPPVATALAGPLGLPFDPADEDAASSERDPFTVDPAVVDRGVQGHARTLNALAETVSAAGYVPRRAAPTEPQFDLAWETPEMIFVAEVKSLTERNAERQLRLGLGQVLRYRHVLGKSGRSVRAVLAVEQRPSDDGWLELCHSLGIFLVWPESMAHVLPNNPDP